MASWVGGVFGSTYALLHEDIELALVLDIEELLAAIGRVGDVQLRGLSAITEFEMLRDGRSNSRTAANSRRFASRTSIARGTSYSAASRLIGRVVRTFIVPVCGGASLLDLARVEVGWRWGWRL